MLTLTSRQSFVLNRTVDLFIETGHPVSSRSVAFASPEPVSPATVRNEMGFLEETGFLAQEHHSSGRIPTDRGYRHYLDHGIRLPSMTAADFEPLSEHFFNRFRIVEEISALAAEAAAVLSEESREMGVLLIPDSDSQDGLPDNHFSMSVTGLRYLLEKPECRDTAKVKPLVRIIEEKEVLQRWIGEHAVTDSPQVFLGEEHAMDHLDDYAIVTAKYESVAGAPAGAIAVIGLKRMAYARVLPAVAKMTRAMSSAMRAINRG